MTGKGFYDSTDPAFLKPDFLGKQLSQDCFVAVLLATTSLTGVKINRFTYLNAQGGMGHG